MVLGMVMCAYNCSTGETESWGSQASLGYISELKTLKRKRRRKRGKRKGKRRRGRQRGERKRDGGEE